MKMSEEYFKKLSDAVKPYDTSENRKQFLDSNPNAVYRESVLRKLPKDVWSPIIVHLHEVEGLNDHHIYEALVAIIPDVA